MSVAVLLGLEVIKLGDIDDNSPWRMTVDVFEDGKMTRRQVTGHYNGWPEGPPERTLADLEHVQLGTADERARKASELDRLDREAAAKIEPIMRELYREQVRVLYGDEGVAFLDGEGRDGTD